MNSDIERLEERLNTQRDRMDSQGETIALLAVRVADLEKRVKVLEPTKIDWSNVGYRG